MRTLIVFIMLIFLVPQPGNYRLTVSVSGIKPVKGDLYLALHNQPQYFNIPDSAFMKMIVGIGAETATAVFKDVPAGRYALAVYHDENKNGKLDANELGIPREGYAFSGKQKGPGKPKFEEAAFELGGNDTLELKLIYPGGWQKK